MRASADGDRDIAREFQASVRTNGNTELRGHFRAFVDRADLRFADPGDDPGRADGPRPLPDLQPVGSRAAQPFRGLGLGNVPDQDIEIVTLLERPERFEDPLGIAVGRINNHEINLFPHEFFHALEGVVIHTDRGRDPQPAVPVDVEDLGIAEQYPLDVAESVESRDLSFPVDQRKDLLLVLFHDAIRFPQPNPRSGSDDLPGHDLLRFQGMVFAEIEIVLRQDADQAVLAVGNQKGMEIELPFFFIGKNLADGHILIDADRFLDEAVQVEFHLGDLGGLFLRAEVLVDDTDPAEFRDLDRHFGLGNGIHGRAGEGNLQANVSRELRLDVDVIRQGRGVSRRQPHVGIGQGDPLIADLLEEGVAFRDKFFPGRGRKNVFIGSCHGAPWIAGTRCKKAGSGRPRPAR